MPVFSKRNECEQKQGQTVVAGRWNAITTLVMTTAKHSQFQMKINRKWEIEWKFFETHLLLCCITLK